MSAKYDLKTIVRAICAVDGESLRRFEQQLVLARKLAKTRVILAEGEVRPRETAYYSMRTAALLTVIFGLVDQNPGLSRIQAITDPEPVGVNVSGGVAYAPTTAGFDHVLGSLQDTDWLLDVVAFTPLNEPLGEGAAKFYGGYRKVGQKSAFVPELLDAKHELNGERFLWVTTVQISKRVRRVLALLSGAEE